MTSVTSPDMVVHVVCDWWPTEESKKISMECQKECSLDPTRSFCECCKRTIEEISERGRKTRQKNIEKLEKEKKFLTK